MVADREESVSRGFIVRGRVQGVGFRWWTHREAERLGMAGTVRNCADGSVEVMARGSAGAMRHFERALRRGPPAAVVDRLEDVPCSLGGDVSTFSIVR